MSAIFVYGTLKPGGAWYHAVEKLVLDHEQATAEGSLYDTGDYPAAKFGGPGVIDGVVLHVADENLDEALAILDRIEDEYRRVTIRTSTGDALAYEWDRSFEGLFPIPGSWSAQG